MPKYATGGANHSQKASMVSGSGSVLVHQNNNYISEASNQGGAVYYLPQSNKTSKDSHNIKLNKGSNSTNQSKNPNMSHKRSKSK